MAFGESPLDFSRGSNIIAIVISSISQKLPVWLRGLALPVIVVLGVVTADLAFFRLANPAPAPDLEFIEGDLISSAEAGALIGDSAPVGVIDHKETYEDFGGFVLVEKSSLLGSDSPLAEDSRREEELLTYTVEDGDTLSSIAKNFGISVGDILEANDKGSSLIKPGEELAILPVTKSGGAAVSSAVAQAPPVSDGGYFIRPVKGGWNWGAVHDSGYMPAVDISSACGSSVYAAAEGKVVRVGNPAYYNSGYGGYIVISHPDGTRTLYAHNSENKVGVGDEVSQGEVIALVGNTGLTYGSTGCHVHFGVSGTSNPFIR